MTRKFILAFVFLVFIISSQFDLVSSDGIIGVSPASTNFPGVLRGGYAERYFTLTSDTTDFVGLNIEAYGNITTWLNYTKNLSISKNSPGRLFVYVTPPTDTPNGNYSAFLRISSDSIGEEVPGMAVSRVRAVLDVAITVEVTDLEVLRCRANSFLVESVEEGQEIIFSANILNQGNIRLRPTLIAKIWDQDQISLLKTIELNGREILPTREENLEFFVPSFDLEIGQYWAEVEISECYASDLLTFDLLEEGALRTVGILQRIESLPWAEVDQTVSIFAIFQNIGEKEVDARFQGKITSDGKIIQILESPIQEVGVSETTNFTFFFTPKKSGKYIASGRVFYNKKRTFELSTSIQVYSNKFGLKYLVLTIVYLLIMFAVGFLFYKVRKERMRYLEKLRLIHG